MTTDTRRPWIEVGYDLFAQHGPSGLKVEVIARRVGKSKSSFYHHFADLEVFTEVLLTYHSEQINVIAEQERLCRAVVPDLVNLLLTYKQDLLFNRQLRVYRHISAFQQCIKQSTKQVGEAILPIWADMLGLPDNSALAQVVLNLSLENFYLQITEETLTYDWLVGYLDELKQMVNAFQHNEIRRTLLYGSV
ncbi:MAG: TetR/AcrR family transcriptional regulator [Cytophagales bacterium]|nr:MAG: TetR/AcrR family transcriptional regulator [Cytophagales bacterium]